MQAHEALHKVLNLSIKSVAVYKAIEQGIRPVSPAEDEALRAFLGNGPAETDAEGQPGEDVSLAAAIRAQAEAIGRLADRLDAFLSPEWLAARVAEALRAAGVVPSTAPAGIVSPSDMQASSGLDQWRAEAVRP